MPKSGALTLVAVTTDSQLCNIHKNNIMTDRQRFVIFQLGRYFCYSMLLALMLSGCGYGKINPKTNEYAKGLYTISNLKRSDQLDNAAKLINESLHKNEISHQEAEWLNEIIARGKKGNWEDAMNKARRMSLSY